MVVFMRKVYDMIMMMIIMQHKKQSVASLYEFEQHSPEAYRI